MQKDFIECEIRCNSNNHTAEFQFKRTDLSLIRKYLAPKHTHANRTHTHTHAPMYFIPSLSSSFLSHAVLSFAYCHWSAFVHMSVAMRKLCIHPSTKACRREMRKAGFQLLRLLVARIFFFWNKMRMKLGSGKRKNLFTCRCERCE